MPPRPASAMLSAKDRPFNPSSVPSPGLALVGRQQLHRHQAEIVTWHRRLRVAVIQENRRVAVGLEEQARDAVVDAHLAQGDWRVVPVVGFKPQRIGFRCLGERDRERGGAPPGIWLSRPGPARGATCNRGHPRGSRTPAPRVGRGGRHRGGHPGERQARPRQGEPPAAEPRLLRVRRGGGGHAERTRQAGVFDDKRHLAPVADQAQVGEAASRVRQHRRIELSCCTPAAVTRTSRGIPRASHRAPCPSTGISGRARPAGNPDWLQGARHEPRRRKILRLRRERADIVAGRRDARIAGVKEYRPAARHKTRPGPAGAVRRPPTGRAADCPRCG